MSEICVKLIFRESRFRSAESVSRSHDEYQANIVKKFVEQYVTMRYPECTLSVEVRHTDSELTVSPSFSVFVTPTNDAIQSDIITFLLQVVPQVFRRSSMASVSVSAIIGLAPFMDSASFYDIWYQSVIDLFPSVNINSVVFVPSTSTQFVQAVLVENAIGRSANEYIMAIQGVGTAIYNQQKGIARVIFD